MRLLATSAQPQLRTFLHGLDSIRSLLDLSDHPDRPCGEANAIAGRHLVEVTEKIAQLVALKTELSRMTAECAGGRVSACKVIEVLHDHDCCAHGHDAGGRPSLSSATP